MSTELHNPGTVQLAPHRPRPRLVPPATVVALVATVVLILIFGPFPAGTEPLDRTDPHAVGVEMLRRQAAGDPSMCQLASPELLPSLRREGSCTAVAGHGSVPTVTVLFSLVCGDRAGVQAQLNPTGGRGKPYAFVSLSQGTNGEWSVSTVMMFTDRAGLRPYRCAHGSDT